MRHFLLVLAALLGLSLPANAQSAFTALDASRSVVTFRGFNCPLSGTNYICSMAVPADTTGAAFGVAGNPFFVSQVPGTSGGWTPTLFAGITNTVQTVKSSAGQVGKLYCDNPNATPIYVETFDVSGTVTLGTTAPTQAYYVQAASAAGFVLPSVGDQYSNAIKIAVVTTQNGSTAPTVPGNCNVSWK